MSTMSIVIVAGFLFISAIIPTDSYMLVGGMRIAYIGLMAISVICVVGKLFFDADLI